MSDYGLQSERLLWPRSGPAGKGPSVVEDEVEALERQLGLTTFGKLWACAQTPSMWPDLFGTSCCTIEMMAIVGVRMTSPASAWSSSASRRARPT